MPCYDKILEVGEEKRQQQIANVKPVNVGIRRQHHLIEAQPIDAIFHTKSHHQVVEQFVLIDFGLAATIGVLWLTRHDDDRTGGRLALGNEDSRLVASFLVAQVILAVAQIGVLDRNLPRVLFGLFFYGIEIFAQFFVGNDPRLKALCRLTVLVQKINDRLSHIVDDPAAHVRVAKFVLRL